MSFNNNKMQAQHSINGIYVPHVVQVYKHSDYELYRKCYGRLLEIACAGNLLYTQPMRYNAAATLFAVVYANRHLLSSIEAASKLSKVMRTKLDEFVRAGVYPENQKAKANMIRRCSSAVRLMERYVSNADKEECVNKIKRAWLRHAYAPGNIGYRRVRDHFYKIREMTVST